MLINKNLGVVQKEALTFDQESSLTEVHANSYPHRGTKVGGGVGWMEPLPGVFDILQYFETILPLVESL